VPDEGSLCRLKEAVRHSRPNDFNGLTTDPVETDVFDQKLSLACVWSLGLCVRLQYILSKNHIDHTAQPDTGPFLLGLFCAGGKRKTAHTVARPAQDGRPGSSARARSLTLTGAAAVAATSIIVTRRASV
jgi:hypothetical protein